MKTTAFQVIFDASKNEMNRVLGHIFAHLG